MIGKNSLQYAVAGGGSTSSWRSSRYSASKRPYWVTSADVWWRSLTHMGFQEKDKVRYLHSDNKFTARSFLDIILKKTAYSGLCLRSSTSYVPCNYNYISTKCDWLNGLNMCALMRVFCCKQLHSLIRNCRHCLICEWWSWCKSPEVFFDGSDMFRSCMCLLQRCSCHNQERGWSLCSDVCTSAPEGSDIGNSCWYLIIFKV